MQTTAAHAQFRPYRYLPRKVFVFSGDVSLFYDRSWGEDRESTDSFTYSLNLGLDGFVIDPRIMRFIVKGNFAHTFNSPRDDISVTGIATRVTLLNERPRHGILRYAPSPIELRYAYYDYDTSTEQNYGISLEYVFARKSSPLALYARDAYFNQNNLNYNQKNLNFNQNNLNNNQNNLNNNQNNLNNQYNLNNNQNIRRKALIQKQKRRFSLPNIFFDFDRHEYETRNSENTQDRLSLRAEAWSRHGEYFGEYRYYDNSGSNQDYKTEELELQANFFYRWKQAFATLESYNTLNIFDDRGDNGVSFIDRTTWIKYLGKNLKDTLTISGGGLYNKRDERDEYLLNLNCAYNRHVSERFLNYTSASTSYGELDDDTVHREEIKNLLHYRISDRLTLSNEVQLGNTEEGIFYGLNIGLNTYKRISISPSYDYRYYELDDGSQDIHTFRLDFSGPIWRRMTFYSQNYYRIEDVDRRKEEFKEKTLHLRANILWRFSRYSVSLGASYRDIKLSDKSIIGVGSQDKDTTLTTIHATMSTYLSRRLFLYIYSYYQKEKDGIALFTFSPQLTWQWRLLRATVQYTLKITNPEERSSTTDHRLFIRTTRQIQSVFKPFW
jgi:hypothetical protein